jgi:hypothetical protein
MAKHTSIEVLKNIVVGDGIYSKTVFLENNIISSSFDEPITISASVKQSLPDNSEYTVSVFPIQPCIKYNDETLAWEFTHGLPNVWSKLNNVSYIESFPSGNNLNDGIYVDVNGQTKYFNKNNWIDMSMEITDMILGNFDTVPTDYAVYQFGNLISGNIITYVNERFDELKKYIDSVKPRYYTEIDIEYGRRLPYSPSWDKGYNASNYGNYYHSYRGNRSSSLTKDASFLKIIYKDFKLLYLLQRQEIEADSLERVRLLEAKEEEKKKARKLATEVATGI